MLTRKDLSLNDSFLEELIAESKLNDLTAIKNSVVNNTEGMRSRDNITTDWYNQLSKHTQQEQASEEPAFTLVTQIAFSLTCLCGFSWTYKPRVYNPPKRYALCCKCRQAVKIHPNKFPKRVGKARI